MVRRRGCRAFAPVHHDREVPVSAAECGWCLRDISEGDFCSDACREKYAELFGDPEATVPDDDVYGDDSSATLPLVY